MVNSFGNNRKGYLYSEKYSDIKYNLAVDIIKNDNVFSGYKQTETYQNVANLCEKELGFTGKHEKQRIIQQLGRLQQLQQLEQLQRLPKTVNKDYKYFSNIEDSILYLDPPYENSDTRNYNSQINHQDFYEWAVEMSKNNIVLISSYEISDNRFECVYEFNTAVSTFSGGKNGKRTEKLFMVVNND